MRVDSNWSDSRIPPVSMGQVRSHAWPALAEDEPLDSHSVTVRWVSERGAIPGREPGLGPLLKGGLGSHAPGTRRTTGVWLNKGKKEHPYLERARLSSYRGPTIENSYFATCIKSVSLWVMLIYIFGGFERKYLIIPLKANHNFHVQIYEISNRQSNDFLPSKISTFLHLPQSKLKGLFLGKNHWLTWSSKLYHS